MSENNEGRSQLELELSASLGQRFSTYVEKKGVTKAEGIQRGLDLLFEADKATDNGLKFGAFGTINGREVRREYVLPDRKKLYAPKPTAG